MPADENAKQLTSPEELVALLKKKFPADPARAQVPAS